MNTIDRRDFLKFVTAGSLLAVSQNVFSLSEKQQTILYSAGSDLEGNFNVCAYEAGAENKRLFCTPLQARAHGIVVHELRQEIIVFARRPEDFILVLDAYSGELKQSIQNDRPLFGHAVLSQDGKTLFTTENDFENKRGIIGVRDVSDNYKKVSEFSSGGVGPHELKLLSNGETLVIANGGILTHPDTGRSKLNLDSMTPALTYVDSQSGKVVDDYRLESKYYQLSIRHIDVTLNDQVCFVMQYQGSRKHKVPLVGFHKGESELQLAKVPPAVLKRMKNYCGSVTADASGETFIVSSPRGNLITVWNNAGELVDSLEIADGCGVVNTKENNGYFVSNGGGDIFEYQSGVTPQKTLLVNNETQRWDNHLIAWHS